MNGVELVLSQFSPTVQRYIHTDGAARWFVGAVRTLQKRVEMLEAKNSFEYHADTSVPSHKSDDNVETGDTNPELQVPRRKSVGEWKYDKVRVRRPRRHAVWAAQSCSVLALDLPVATTPMDEYVTSAPITEFVIPPVAILLRLWPRSLTSWNREDRTENVSELEANMSGVQWKMTEVERKLETVSNSFLQLTEGNVEREKTGCIAGLLY